MKLVTGGTGLLGSHLLVELTKKNYPVRSIFRDEKKIEHVKNLSLLFSRKLEKLLAKNRMDKSRHFRY